MKIKFLLLNLILLFILPACDRQKNPTVTLLNDRFITTNVEISPGGVLMFKWIAEKGKADLESFTIRVDGVDYPGYPVNSIDPEIFFDSTYMEGPVSEGDYTYAFMATDVDGNIGEKAIVVTVQ